MRMWPHSKSTHSRNTHSRNTFSWSTLICILSGSSKLHIHTYKRMQLRGFLSVLRCIRNESDSVRKFNLHIVHITFTHQLCMYVITCSVELWGQLRISLRITFIGYVLTYPLCVKFVKEACTPKHIEMHTTSYHSCVWCGLEMITVYIFLYLV